MKCNKCNHSLPEDSEFCQYCGTKIEKSAFDTLLSQDLNTMDSDEVLSKVLAAGIIEGERSKRANTEAQELHLNDPEYGFVPEKPIYTNGINGEEQYLSSLRDLQGDRLTWTRSGSMPVENINGIVDIFQLKSPSGKTYTLYINMYASKTSTTAPVGFTFAKLAPQTAKPYKEAQTQKPTAKMPIIEGILNIAALCIFVLMSGLIIAIMNIQDINRDRLLDIPPSLIYGLFLAINAAAGILILLMCFKKYFHNQWVFSSIITLLTLIQFIIVTNKEGTIWCSRASNQQFFINSELINTLNSSIVILSLILLIYNLALLIYLIFSQVVIHRWHDSIKYREQCYKRVEKMYNYYQSGIITEEEYEKAKMDITKHIH